MRSSARILYVDVDKDLCDLAGALQQYTDLQCTVVSTESAREARLLIVKELFDLYIFNCRMPDISGVELCQCVRRFDSTTPVVFFSASPELVDADDQTPAGVNEYIVKPNDLKELLTTVKRLLDKSAAVQARKSVVSLKPRYDRFAEIGGKTAEEKFSRNQAGGKSRVRSAVTGAAIFAVIVLHLVSQFDFIQNEKIAFESETVNKQIVETKPEIEQRAEVELETERRAGVEPENKARVGAENKPKYEARSSKVKTAPDAKTTLDAAPTESKIAPSWTVIKKKGSGESKAERLRRAEKFLTGV